MPSRQGSSLWSRLLRISAPSAPDAPQAGRASFAVSSGGRNWEDDPRWGRQHWRVRREPIRWPDGARLAVVCSIPFGIPDLAFKSEQAPYIYSGPRQYTGTVQRVHIQLYGVKAGIWRLLELLDRHGFKASFEINGLVAVQFPEAVREIDRRGHEIVGYYWANNVMHDEQVVEQDRELIRRTLSALERVTAKRPSGWVAPGLRLGEKTLDFLAEEGIKWHACDLSDDIPYAIEVAGKKIIVLPHAEPHLDDAGFIIGTRRPAEVYLEFFERQFSALYREGASMPKMFVFSIHPELGGRPFMTRAIEEMLSYLKSFSDIWLTTRQQIADWWIKNNYS